MTKVGMTPSRCTIIIPVFNKWELTKNCLESLHEHTTKEQCRIIVVDNGSTDATANELAPLGAQLFDTAFRHIRFEENRNFAAACNVGANAATTTMLFFLNNDTLATPHWFEPLYQSFSNNPHQGATGPLLLYANKTVQHLGVTFSPDGVFHLYQGFPHDHPAVRAPRSLQAITAAALMIPKKLFEECHGFHEEYRNGFEDIELSGRIRQQGKTLSCTPDSTIFHLESQTPGRHDHRTHNNRLLHARCAHLFRVDIHTLALADGFDLVLDELLKLRIVVSAEESKKMICSVLEPPELSLVDLVLQNPYWVEGLLMLSQVFEAAGEERAAITLRQRLCSVLLKKEYLEPLLPLLARNPDEELLHEANERLAQLNAFAASPHTAMERCSNSLNLAIQFNDSFLIATYTAALKTIKNRILQKR